MSTKSFYNYDNNIEVLNEGFFDFIWRFINKIFHSLFKVNKFSDLYKRVAELENIIKFGQSSIKEGKTYSNTTKLNEGRSRTKHVLEANDSSSSSEIEDPNEIDLPPSQPNKTVDMNKVDMNIPSFPQVAKQLLNGLDKQMKRNKERLSIERIQEDIENVQNGSVLSQQYVQILEIIVTDFIRKYSSGQLTLPRPEKGKMMSERDIQTWLKYTENAKNRGGDKMFSYVYNTMEQIVNNYEKKFNEEYNNLKEDENSFIKKYKDGEANKRDRDFLAEWDDKIISKVKDVKEDCIQYIPTAISEYFISNDIYRDATDYVKLALQLLVANSKNVASSNKNIKNTLLEYVSDWMNDDKDDIIDIINDEKNQILNTINGDANYSELKKYLDGINENTIDSAIKRINSIRGVKSISDKDLALLTERDIENATGQTSISIIISLLIHSINNNFKFEMKNIGDIFNIIKK